MHQRVTDISLPAATRSSAAFLLQLHVLSLLVTVKLLTFLTLLVLQLSSLLQLLQLPSLLQLAVRLVSSQPEELSQNKFGCSTRF